MNINILYSKVFNYIIGKRRLLLSYSGGLDSTVLLDILVKLRSANTSSIDNSVLFPLSIRAVHVHHGINNHADMWAQHCIQQCKMRDVPCHIVHIDCVTKNSRGSNLEALMRKLRYQCLYNCLLPEEILVTGHHMNDQIESFFLALKRGSGPSGLSGMKTEDVIPLRYYNDDYKNQTRLLRPLLGFSKKELEEYAVMEKLVWVEDDMNKDINFDRSFLRIQILPLLYRRWPALNKVIIRTMQLCREQEYVINELLLKSLSKLINLDGSLFFNPLLQYSGPKRRALLRLWLANFLMYMPSYQILHRIWTEVVLSRPDCSPILQLDKHNICRRFHKKLYILPKEMTFTLKRTKLLWRSIDNIISLPYNLGLLVRQSLCINLSNYQKIFQSEFNKKFLLNVYYNFFKKPGEILSHSLIRYPKSYEEVSIQLGYSMTGLLYIVDRKHSRSLKKIWQEFKIPPWLRSRIPIIFYENILITAMGVFITQNGNIKITEQHDLFYSISWIQNLEQNRFFKSHTRNIVW